MIVTPGYPIARSPEGHLVYGPDRHINCRALLSCDECRQPICWVFDNDLNGSYFQCFDCKTKDLLAL